MNKQNKNSLILKLKEKIEIAADAYDFLFVPNRKLKFKPGQYLALTLGGGDKKTKSEKRYFSIASSPAEPYIRIGVKFHAEDGGATRYLLSLKPGAKVAASKPAGNLILPKDKNKKLVFMAGGIGITPFRSMIKYFLEADEKRDIVLFYSNYTPADIVYKDVLDDGKRRLGIKIIYTITNVPCPVGWRGETCFIDRQMIERAASDYKERIFYLSGSQGMVSAISKILLKMGVGKNRIKTDLFSA